MNFTDLFIKRPVLSAVISILILLLGMRALHELKLRQFPKIEKTVITVSTAYPGANAKLMQSFITTPLEKAVAQADGVDYITASSAQSTSRIKAHIKLNYSPNIAFTNIMTKVAQIRNQLPKASQQPVISKNTGDSVALMYLSYSSQKMKPEQITDYISRVVQPKLETIDGVASAQILGGKTFAMRIWLNPQRMAGLGVTPSDISNALQANNFQTAAGHTKGNFLQLNVKADTDIHNVKQFKQLIIKHQGNSIVRLRDIAKVELGSESYDSSVTFNGKKAIFVAVSATPSANPLNVIDRVKRQLPQLAKSYPATLHSKVVYDATKYIQSAISEVVHTILEATLIVIFVIFIFLGDIRTVTIPVVTIPLSLIGVFSLMLALGYSLNLLTLLAMVLAIGLVVDDAIVVVENIHRHISEGKPSLEAALMGAREIATPVIAMTITLAAVYTPIGLMTGLTGSLFKEFAFTLSSTVILSGVIALTLSPMMCSKIFSNTPQQSALSKTIDTCFNRLKGIYIKCLHEVLRDRYPTVILAAIILCSCYFLFMGSAFQLAPKEDQGFLMAFAAGPTSTDLDYLTTYTKQIETLYAKNPATEDYFVINGTDSPNHAFTGLILKKWDERPKSSVIAQELQPKLSKIPGINTFITQPSSLPGSDHGSTPVQFVLTSTSNYHALHQEAEKLMAKARESKMFLYLNSNLKFNRPQIELNINRNKAGELGISMQDIGQALSNSLSGNYANRFSLSGQSYDVIPSLSRRFTQNPEQLKQIYLRTSNGSMVPLSTIASITQTIQPNNLDQFQQLNAVTISGIMNPRFTLAEGLNFLRTQAEKSLAKNISYDYRGQSRRLIHSGNSLVFAFFFALMVIFLVLAAQFESFKDPLIMLISVPMSTCGALIPIYLGAASINIYTEIGLITLIGLISKHGILMVDFANKLRNQHPLSAHNAIVQAASTRLRPILMTTAAMVMGVIPLLFAKGAGAVSRFDLGLVIASGMSIGTCFTLFMVPVFYTLLSSSKTKHLETATTSSI